MPGKDKGNGAKARGAHQQLNKEYFLGEPLTTVGEDDRGLVAAVASPHSRCSGSSLPRRQRAPHSRTIIRAGQVEGALGVAGASDEQDVECALAGIDALEEKGQSSYVEVCVSASRGTKAMEHPTPSDFIVEVEEGHVSMTFKPTDSSYSFGRLADPEDIARHGPLSRSPNVRHAKTGDTGAYAPEDVAQMAQSLAIKAITSP